MTYYGPHYARWQGMRARCLNKRSPGYHNYGGRGITIFEPWICSHTAFSAWLDLYLGPCPDYYSLDRIDNDWGYHPGNLRWASAQTQANNTRVYKGENRTQLPIGIVLQKSLEGLVAHPYLPYIPPVEHPTAVNWRRSHG